MADNDKVKEQEARRSKEIAHFKEVVEKIRKKSFPFIFFAILPFIMARFVHLSLLYWVPIFAVCFVPVTIWYGTHAFKAVKAWENGLVLFMDKPWRIRKPGWTWIWWPFQKIKFREMQEIEVDIPKQLILTTDEVMLEMDGTIYLRPYHVCKSYVNVKDLSEMIKNLGMAAFKEACSSKTIDQINALKAAGIGSLEKDIANSLNTQIQYDEREADVIRKSKGNYKLHGRNAEQFDLNVGWGAETTKTKVVNIGLPADVQKARQAKDVAQHEGEAKVIAAKLAADAFEVRANAIHKNDPTFAITSTDAMKEAKNVILVGGTAVEDWAGLAGAGGRQILTRMTSTDKEALPPGYPTRGCVAKC